MTEKIENMPHEIRTLLNQLQDVNNRRASQHLQALELMKDLNEIEKTASRLHNELTNSYMKANDKLDKGTKDV